MNETQITVSYERKFSDGNYGSEGLSLSLTVSVGDLPDGQMLTDVLDDRVFQLRTLVLSQLALSNAERVAWAARRELSPQQPVTTSGGTEVSLRISRCCPSMTTETALATRDLTLSQIKQRIELNRQSGWGLEKASAAQLNWLALYCQRNSLLPGTEVTLYEGKPWTTIDGHVTLMRRQPEYRGYSQRPLSKAEKEEWGYDEGDLVVETTIRTATQGEIKAHGRVSAAEREGTFVQGVRHNPVARHHAVAMAQKRSLARAQRLTFGMESFCDEEEFEREVTTMVEERTDPERVRRESAEYDRIASTFYEEHTSAPVATTGAVEDDVSADASPDADTSTDTIDAPLVEAFQRNMQLGMDATSLGIKGIGHLRAKDNWTLEQVTDANDKLAAKMNAWHEAQGAF